MGPTRSDVSEGAPLCAHSSRCCSLKARPGLSLPTPSQFCPHPKSYSQVSPLLQVSGVELQQSWGQRLEHLQQAVAQLEIDRSLLQHHNIQLRAALEQVERERRKLKRDSLLTSQKSVLEVGKLSPLSAVWQLIPFLLAAVPKTNPLQPHSRLCLQGKQMLLQPRDPSQSASEPAH